MIPRHCHYSAATSDRSATSPVVDAKRQPPSMGLRSIPHPRVSANLRPPAGDWSLSTRLVPPFKYQTHVKDRGLGARGLPTPGRSRGVRRSTPASAVPVHITGGLRQDVATPVFGRESPAPTFAFRPALHLRPERRAWESILRPLNVPSDPGR